MEYGYSILMAAFAAAILFYAGLMAIFKDYKMLPYLVTIVVLCVVSRKKKRENQAPASLGMSYFREER